METQRMTLEERAKRLREGILVLIEQTATLTKKDGLLFKEILDLKTGEISHVQDRIDAAIESDLHAALAAQREGIDHLKARNWNYSEAVTILLGCDHGDEQTCGCRDRAMERIAAIRQGEA